MREKIQNLAYFIFMLVLICGWLWILKKAQEVSLWLIN